VGSAVVFANLVGLVKDWRTNAHRGHPPRDPRSTISTKVPSWNRPLPDLSEKSDRWPGPEEFLGGLNPPS
jgi:hypothetical protein